MKRTIAFMFIMFVVALTVMIIGGGTDQALFTATMIWSVAIMLFIKSVKQKIDEISEGEADERYNDCVAVIAELKGFFGFVAKIGCVVAHIAFTVISVPLSIVIPGWKAHPKFHGTLFDIFLTVCTLGLYVFAIYSVRSVARDIGNYDTSADITVDTSSDITASTSSDISNNTAVDNNVVDIPVVHNPSPEEIIAASPFVPWTSEGMTVDVNTAAAILGNNVDGYRINNTIYHVDGMGSIYDEFANDYGTVQDNAIKLVGNKIQGGQFDGCTVIKFANCFNIYDVTGRIATLRKG